MVEDSGFEMVLREIREGIWARLDGFQCSDDDDLDDLGLGSVDVIVVLSDLEQRHSFTVDDDDLVETSHWSIRAFATLAARKLGASHGS